MSEREGYGPSIPRLRQTCDDALDGFEEELARRIAVEAERDALREKWEPNRTGKYPADHPLIKLQEAEEERDMAQALVRKEFPVELIQAARGALIFALSSPEFAGTVTHREVWEALGALLPTHPKGESMIDEKVKRKGRALSAARLGLREAERQLRECGRFNEAKQAKAAIERSERLEQDYGQAVR